MADTRINALSTATVSISDDFLPIDGTTAGTKKLSAFNPTFGGNATVGGTLTVSSTADFLLKNGAWYSSAESSQRLLFSTSGTSYLKGHGAGQVVVLRNGSDSAAVTVYSDLSTVFAGKVEATDTTASTTTSSGALVVGNGTSGGLGVGGAANIGGALSMYGEDFTIHNVGYGSWVLRNTAGSAVFDIRNGAGSWLTFPNLAGTVEFKTLATTVKVAATTASTGTSSGALVVSGGVGVAKELYVGSATDSSTNTTGAVVVTGGLGIGGNLNMGGRLFINNTTAANGALSASGIIADFGADGTLGGLKFNVKGFPSATAGSRYIQLTAADTLDFRELRINDLGGNVLLGGATSTVKIGGSFQVGNAYVAGAPTATGYIVIKDSTGTSYKIPAVAL